MLLLIVLWINWTALKMQSTDFITGQMVINGQNDDITGYVGCYYHNFYIYLIFESQ